MTHTNTEQERAEFEAVASDYGACPKAIGRDAKGNYLLMHTATGWMWWQAARRAPVVPVQPTSKQVVLGSAAILGQPEGTADNRDPNWKQAVEQAERAYLAILAAAPQPTEAAPVQMPEPFTTLVRKKTWSTNCYEAAPLANHRDYGRRWAD